MILALLPEYRKAGSLVFKIFLSLFAILVVESALGQTPQASVNHEIQKNRESVIEKHSYVHTRTLNPAHYSESYGGLLDPTFIDTLYSPKTQRWLDVGAGEGMALIDYLYGVAGGASVVGITVETDWRYNGFRIQAARDFPGRFRFYKGKYLEDPSYSPETLGHFDIVTDVYGAFSYSNTVDVVLQKIGDLLKVGGHFFTVYKADTFFIYDSKGNNIPINQWINSGSCLAIVPREYSKLNMGNEEPPLHIVKTCEKVSVPPLKLSGFQSDSPPTRKYEWVSELARKKK